MQGREPLHPGPQQRPGLRSPGFGPTGAGPCRERPLSLRPHGWCAPAQPRAPHWEPGARAFVSQLYLEERDALGGMVFELEMLSPPPNTGQGERKTSVYSALGGQEGDPGIPEIPPLPLTLPPDFNCPGCSGYLRPGENVGGAGLHLLPLNAPCPSSPDRDRCVFPHMHTHSYTYTSLSSPLPSMDR